MVEKFLNDQDSDFYSTPNYDLYFNSDEAVGHQIGPDPDPD